MRSWLLLLITQLCACQAIVGSYEVGSGDTGAALDSETSDALTETAADGALPDTAAPDTAATDGAADAALVVTSCKAHKAKDPTLGNGPQPIIPKGSPGYPDGLTTFCEMDKSGGSTLVAIRASNTNAFKWRTMPPAATLPSTVEKSFNLGPEDDKDAYLAIDWTLLGATEIVYELGVPTTVGAPKSRLSFRELTSAQIGAGLIALTKGHMKADRPNCFVDMATTAVTNCWPSAPPPGDPMKSIGWPHAPTGTLCYWGYDDANGTLACDGTTSGRGRIFVK